VKDDNFSWDKPFTSDDFIKSKTTFHGGVMVVDSERLQPELVADIANARFKELIENAPRVFGCNTGKWYEYEKGWTGECPETHEARLWNPREIKK